MMPRKTSPAFAPDSDHVIPSRPARPTTRRLLLPDLDWVEIPAGDFIYQKGERRTLPRYFMARYPVTNIQYQTFIDDAGYEDSRWWTDLKKPEPEQSHWPQPNRPKTNVDWYEATAFCRWLSAQLGYAIRLPTEVEWEKAARGTYGHIWPWGNEYSSGLANINEIRTDEGSWYLKQTCAVGVFPHDASASGVMDMAGNVREWCSNKYDHPEDSRPDLSGARRALRGGSWGDSPALARADDSGGVGPVGRYYLVGIRLCSSAPIE